MTSLAHDHERSVCWSSVEDSIGPVAMETTSLARRHHLAEFVERGGHEALGLVVLILVVLILVVLILVLVEGNIVTIFKQDVLTVSLTNLFSLVG